MICEVALVSGGENAPAHHELLEELRSGGLAVHARPTLAEALPLFRLPDPPQALILDSPLHWDADLVRQVLDVNPGLPKLVFAAGSAVKLELSIENASGGNQTDSGSVYAFESSLNDDGVAALIQATVRRALGQKDEETPAPIIAEAAPSRPEFERGHAPANPEQPAATKDQAAPGLAVVKDKLAFFYSETFLRRVGSANIPVLLHGETGAGKEVMARRLWSYSERAGKPFLKLNCAALPSELIESELFGYEKGAFTGATMDKPGKFELAQNGTILLDEIGDMDIRLQAKLLQVLQDGEVRPLGSSRVLNVNVRVMAATHRDLRKAIRHGSFREDLYYRLSVINLTIPPLRERRHEILPLAAKLLARHAPESTALPVISPALEEAMLAYDWPGNVRELENVMRRFLVYQDADLLAEELDQMAAAMGQPLQARSVVTTVNPGLADFAPQPCSRPDLFTKKPDPTKKIDYLAEASRQAESKLLLETLDALRWNRRQAAARLNIDYKAFLYKLQKYGIADNKRGGGAA